MLYLEKPKAAFVKKYCDEIVTMIEKNLAQSPLPVSVKTFLTRSRITDIIISEPKDLMGFHEDIIPLMGTDFTLLEYNKYFSCIKIQEDKRKEWENEIITKYKSSIADLKKIFNYTEFISERKHFSYWVAEQLNVNTCVYCNRNYTLTIKYKDPNTKRENDDYRITRPQFDHWYSKSKYPLLALSIYNLIPSCAVCNSGIKGSKEFNLVDNVHPYDKAKEEYTFTYIPNGTLGFDIKIKVEDNSKMDKTLRLLRLEELYRSHNKFELNDLINLSKKYNSSYKNLLFKEMFDNFELSNEEIYRLIFGIDIEDYSRRPLSKFKHEIIEELKKSV